MRGVLRSEITPFERCESASAYIIGVLLASMGVTVCSPLCDLEDKILQRAKTGQGTETSIRDQI